MSWIQWRLNIKVDIQEPLETWLLEIGAISITYQDAADDPVLETMPGELRLWHHLLVVALFDADCDTRALEQAMMNTAFKEEIVDHRWEALEDKDWVRAWMDDYKPMKFGNTLWICPTNTKPPEPDAVNLMLDPGLAFGTGTHPTTALCLTFLEKQIQGGESIIDFGCGSGVLALAALKLGADKVIGVDHDPQALVASRANAELNQINQEDFEVYTSDTFTPEIVDAVVANILAATLKELVVEIVTLVKSGGWIALSGILESQISSVQQTYAPWIEFDEPKLMGEWALLTGIKK